MISIDNKPGSGDIYLATPSILPDLQDPPVAYETRTLSGNVVHAGTRGDIGPLDWQTFAEVLRLMPGADAAITVRYRGQG